MGEDLNFQQDEPDNLPAPTETPDEPEEADPMDEEEQGEEDESDEEDLTSEEVKEIDSRLDALNIVLDQMEQKRDSIHAKLMELLESSREIRQQMRQEMQENLGKGTN